MNLYDKIDRKIPNSGNLLLLGFNFFFIFAIPFFPVSLHNTLSPLVFSMIFLTSTFALNSWRRMVFSIAIIALITEWLAYILNLELINLISSLVNILFFQLIVIKLIIQVAKSRKADASIILESINGYLMLGMLFTIWVALSMTADPQAFQFNTDDPTLRDYIYFTFVTMTTLGYGEITPQLPFAKAIATFIATSGQIYIAVIVAMLVGKYAAAGEAPKIK